MVGGLGRQVAGLGQLGLVFGTQAGELRHALDALGHAEFVETADAAGGVEGAHGANLEKVWNGLQREAISLGSQVMRSGKAAQISKPTNCRPKKGMIPR
ncbi:hypothetical protein D9M69_619060 [compost metagenome]